MRDRFLRLVEPAVPLAGLRSMDPAPADAGLAVEEATVVLRRDLELPPRDWAVFLLHTACEIEHALLVQYLYAAYSIRPGLIAPGGQSSDDWKCCIVGIAREEMGHLVTLQNILHTLGGPLNFEREDFPYRSQLYPFHFRLEPFSKGSLAKYVAAEMPVHVDPAVLPTAERDEIWVRAMDAAGGQPVNHVGELYRALVGAVSALPEDVFRGDRIAFQATKDEGWGTSDDETPAGIKVIPIRGATACQRRDEVVRALRIIALQGEGASGASVDGSHFKRFLDIYRSLPAEGFDPAFPVSTDPCLPGDSAGQDTIEDPTTQLWARLFNVRYRILLTSLVQSLELPATAEADPRETVIRWVFGEMAGGPASVKTLAQRLVEMPRDRRPGPTAGAPFGLPYTLALPSQLNERWQLQLDLVDASIEIIRAIEDPPRDPVLVSIYDYELHAGTGRRGTIASLLEGP